MVTSDRWRVVLVDDHQLFRSGIAALMSSCDDFELVGEAASGPEAIEITRAVVPDMVLMDIHMPGGDGLEAVKAIKKEMPQVKIAILTVSDADEDLFTAIKNGADGYLLKNIGPSVLFSMLREMRHGEAAISKTMADRILHEFRKEHTEVKHSPAVEEDLTPREIEMLELLVKGDLNQEIAEALHISESAVKLHLRVIMEKLHLRNRIQLAVYAVRQGLVSDEPDG